jgi:diaminopimelate decarboxylase
MTLLHLFYISLTNSSRAFHILLPDNEGKKTVRTVKNILTPEDWGLKSNTAGELLVNNFKLTDLAQMYNTPLYVLNEENLIERAEEFKNNAAKIFYGNARTFYPFKCNSVPAVINAIRKTGLSAEVMTEFELELALTCGFHPSEIIVNGPGKTENFLNKCINNQVGMIVIDSISELMSLINIQKSNPAQVDLLFRVNPDFIPKGLSKSSATGSRHCSFGMDNGEILNGLSIIKNFPKLVFRGIHFHIGTGIRNPKAHSQVIQKLYPLFRKIKSLGYEIKVLDVGGGFASMTTRELSSFEMIASQTLSSYQLEFGRQKFYSFDDYMNEINKAVSSFFGSNVPEIYFEPGRCLVSAAQILLLRVHRIKERNGKKWLITDGGLGTITMPTYYEYHEMYLCNEYNRSLKEKVTITGSCCFASDLVYKNKLLPRVKEGEVLALTDTGAYFNALESSFNFNKPGIIMINGDECEIVRRRETFSDMIERDTIKTKTIKKENCDEIYSC